MRDLTDLNTHLFAQLEKLGDEDLKGDELKQELVRSKGMTEISAKIIEGGRLMLDAQIKIDDMQEQKQTPKQLT